MASFTVTCKQCGTEQEFSSEDPSYKDKYGLFDPRYFEKGKTISISANGFSDPPEVSIECHNPECGSEI